MEDGLRLDVEQSGLEALEGVNHLAHGLGEAAASLGTVVSQQRCYELLDDIDGAIGAYAHRAEMASLEALGEQPFCLHRNIDRLLGDKAFFVGVEQSMIDQLPELVERQAGAARQFLEADSHGLFAVGHLPSAVGPLPVLTSLPHGQLGLDHLQREVLVTL
jgi:hypothetical protein